VQVNSSQQQDGLKRGLKNRHIQLIALGGAIGTGLFLGSASVLQAAGPSMILGYAIGGIIAFMIMRQLGEMVAQEPVAGSFSHFAYKYWGDFPGFLSGWNYWVLYVLVSMAELTAVGTYVHYWWPGVPTWVSALVCFAVINAINLANVKAYGETEFWFAIIKVVAVIGMIVFGAYLLISGHGGPQASITNLWSHGGFFPHGFHGLFMMLAVIMFSFGGLELIGITAAEAADPQKSIPKAVNQVIYRILIFYICSLAVLLSLYPWNEVAAGGSPFVMIFSQIGSTLTANVLNVVVLTAALPRGAGQRAARADEGRPARRAVYGDRFVGTRYLYLRDRQLPDSGGSARLADGAGRRRAGAELGTDQPDPSEIAQGHGRGG
jgi:aromatic amino acid transport protein AroP